MCSLGRIAEKRVSNCENSSDKLCSTSEETFDILSFCDFDFCGSPCLNENLINLLQKSPLDIRIMDQFQEDGIVDATEGEDCFVASPPVAQLSSEVDLGHTNFGLDFGKNWFLAASSTKSRRLNYPEDLVALLPSVTDELLDSEDKSELLDWNNQGQTPAGVTDRRRAVEAATRWLSKTAISPDQLTFSSQSLALTEESDSAGRYTAEALKEIAIPSSVQEAALFDIRENLEATASAADILYHSASSSKSRKRQRQSVDPGTAEYKKKRELNNISVRKSREKSRQKQQETEKRVDTLSAENSKLQARVDSLEKELSILKGLFTNIGATLPAEISNLLSAD